MNGYKICISLVVGAMLLGGANPARADLTPDLETAERIATETSVTVGYRGVGTDDNPGRAREYDSLEPSPTFKGKLFTDKGAYHLDLGVDYLNEDRNCKGPFGARALSVANMAVKCIQGRAVLLDLHAHFGRKRHPVTYADIEHIMAADTVGIEKG